jgi:diguanylate cyclase (GGDEF)-like protein/PAS domain S-box-containing protein
VGVAVIAAVGAAAVRVGDARLADAEADRLGARVSLVQQVAPKSAASQAAIEADTAVDLAHFSAEDRATDAAALERFQLGAAGDRPALAALVAADGRVLATSPPARALAVDVLGTTWRDALGGRRGITDVFRYETAWATANLVPVGAGAPWAVLVLVTRAFDTLRQSFYGQLGSLSGGPGGLALLDRRGVASASWNPTEVGAQVLPPAELAQLSPDAARVWTTERDGHPSTYVGEALASGYSLVFEQETDLLYGDLRAAQRQRDLSLVGVLAGTLAALVLFQWARERAARRAEKRLRALLENSQDLILVAGPDGALTFVSPAIEALLGHPPETWAGRPLTDLVHPADAAGLRALRADPGSGPLLNVRLAHRDGDHRWFDVQASDVRGDPDLAGTLLTCHDVGQRKVLQDELTFQATHDSLTRLPNRAELSQHLDQLLGGDGAGSARRGFALLYIDLDHFKPVNDTLGHDAGDRVLGMVAERLKVAAGDDGFVCRMGGDEFAVLIDGTDEAAALDTARRLRDAIRAPVPVGAALVRVDASIGVAFADPDLVLDNPEVLVRLADQAMFRAKEAGRGSASLASPRSPAGAGSAATPPAGPSPVPLAAPGAGPAAPAPRRARPLPADPPRRPRHRSVGRRLIALAPLAAAAAIVVGIALFGYGQTSASRRAAERSRLTEMQKVTARGSDYYSRQFGPERVVNVASSLPWTFDGSPLDQTLTTSFATAFGQGRPTWAALATLDGRVLAAAPAGTPLAVAPDGPAWRAAAGGTASIEPFVDVGGQLRSYYVFPLRHDGRPVAVYAIGLAVEDALVAQLFGRLGSLDGGTGGWSLVDARGAALASWRPELLGRPVASAADVAALAEGAGPGSPGEGGTVVLGTLMAPMSSPAPIYLVYTASVDDFYRDLRLGRGASDLSFLGVVLVAVGGLAVFHHRRERSVRRMERRLDALLRHAHDVVVVLDHRGRARFVSSAIGGLLGHRADQRVGLPLTDLVHPDDRARLDEATAAARSQNPVTVADVRLRDREGAFVWFDIDAIDLHEHPEVAGTLLTCHEIGERRAYQETLAHRASHDALTGLPNRARFSTRLEQLAVAPGPGTFAVLFIDLDHFKPVNDRLGHDAGDHVLRVVAERLRGSIRVGDTDALCRLGGDEFAVLLVDVTEDVARDTATRVLGAIAQPIGVAGTTVTISATIGIALSHPDDEHPDTVVRNADLAMYSAKDAGRGGYVVAG